MNDYQSVYKELYNIYQRYCRLYSNNPDLEQMCCMWSLQEPPDIIWDSPPIEAIEKVFDISIDENDALELYDMYLDEAVEKIMEIIYGASN
jgi:hypothetical protein